MQSSLKQHIPGILLALVIAACAYALGLVIPVVGGPVFGISLGIVVSTLWKPPVATRKGLKFTSKYILQLAVILLGFEMNLASIIQTGRNSLLVILITLSTAFLVAILVGRSLKLEPKLYTLIGVGTAICGGSAIAAASSAIDADDQDISYSISTIFLFNVIAVFLFPLAGHLLHLSDAGFGMWAGTAINDTSSVVAAGYAYSDAAGSFATIVKLTRSLMILPVTLALAMLFSRQNQEGGSFNLGRVFPWFILGFLAAAVLRSVGIIPAGSAHTLVALGKFFIIMAMTAIGLNTDIKAMIKAGPRALLLGASTWMAVILSSLSVQYLIQTW